jgi:hypothetical protein
VVSSVCQLPGEHCRVLNRQDCPGELFTSSELPFNSAVTQDGLDGLLAGGCPQNRMGQGGSVGRGAVSCRAH